MERLTTIDSAGRNVVKVKRFCDSDDWIISEMADGVTIRFSSKAINKLADIEDFMEEQGFESLEQLKDELSGLKAGYDFVWEQGTDAIKELVQENQKCKNNWQKLKKYVETLSNESDTISEDLYFIKEKMQEIEKDD